MYVRKSEWWQLVERDLLDYVIEEKNDKKKRRDVLMFRSAAAGLSDHLMEI